MTQAAEQQQALSLNEPMAKHTSWRVGGLADRFFRPADPAALGGFLRATPQPEPLYWLGLGSNVLVRDGGLRGTVICLTGLAHSIERQADGGVYVGAATPCAKVARATAAWGLGGAEFLAGIPGTVGGALAMNAGAWGAETWRIVERAETLDRQGRLETNPAAAFQPAYRRVSLPPDRCFTGAYLRLAAADRGAAQERIRELLRRRAESQPGGQISCGSVFKNPRNDYAGRLLEACGLKGHAIGGAVISDKHANFIINNGEATAADIEALIDYARAAVRERFQIELAPEVKIIGEAAQP